MIAFLEVKEKLEQEEKCLDSQLWQACAGTMVQMPPVNSKVFYFPQGHAERANGPVDFKKCRRFPLPPYILCRVASAKHMADPDTDEVYAKLMLLPLNGKEADYGDDDGAAADGSEALPKLPWFVKTLTQSDANNGGGFSVPRYCAEAIFPPLDFTAEPPLQSIEAKDVHGKSWVFKHIYRGTPRRHLLTTGWSHFVNNKKLVAGDSIVFFRGRDGDLYVGIRRAKRGNNRRFEPSSVWISESDNCSLPYEGFSALLNGDDSKKLTINDGSEDGMFGSRMGSAGKVKAEAVIEAASLAANGEPFEVVYYPRASAPEFCVKASLLKTALQIRWCSGMRFKISLEAEDSSRINDGISGTISSVQVADPLLWPDSPWRLLQVTWDDPGLLQNVKRLNPWMVQLLSNVPAIPPPFSPPRKKMRLLHQHPDVPLDPQIYAPTFGSNLLGPMNNPFGYHIPETTTTPACMQGARHAYYGLPLPDYLSKLQLSPLYFTGFPLLGHASMQSSRLCDNSSSAMQRHGTNENVASQLIPNENSAESLNEEDDDEETPHLMLFGKRILPEKHT